MYFDYADYVKFHNDISETEFPRYQFMACRELDIHTTGLDGYRKLQEAYPESDYDIQAVKACGCEIAHTLYRIEESQGDAINSDGSMKGRVISSVSSGSESISYAVNGNIYTEAGASNVAKSALIKAVCDKWLSGIKDKNGVNLLYMGRYNV